MTLPSTDDAHFMKRALDLAARGCGHVSPNPMVGAVIVRDGKVLAEGWHRKYGSLHAERDALRACAEAGTNPAGATMYVTLEPCCHQGKQPPCTDALLEAGIARVVVGASDPNPLVAGQGLAILREAGVSVCEHVLEDKARALNETFFHFIQTKRPFVTMKYAMTLDGKIACVTGESRWVTGEQARHHVHEQRNAADAIMVGVGTVLADNPQLTCRIEGGMNPLRIICDSHLRTPLSSHVVTDARETPTCIATLEANEAMLTPYRKAGAEIITLPAINGHLDLNALMERLGARGVASIILEGGSQLNWSALEAGIVNKVQAYVAPKLFGGANAKTPVGGAGFPSPATSIALAHVSITQLGDDFLIEGYPTPAESPALTAKTASAIAQPAASAAAGGFKQPAANDATADGLKPPVASAVSSARAQFATETAFNESKVR